jgi:hypothetical protein
MRVIGSFHCDEEPSATYGYELITVPARRRWEVNLKSDAAAATGKIGAMIGTLTVRSPHRPFDCNAQRADFVSQTAAIDSKNPRRLQLVAFGKPQHAHDELSLNQPNHVRI